MPAIHVHLDDEIKLPNWNRIFEVLQYFERFDEEFDADSADLLKSPEKISGKILIRIAVRLFLFDKSNDQSYVLIFLDISFMKRSNLNNLQNLRTGFKHQLSFLKWKIRKIEGPCNNQNSDCTISPLSCYNRARAKIGIFTTAK